MNKRNINWAIAITMVLFFPTWNIFGQNVSYSPYTVFGIGDIENSDYGRYSGMGGVGTALKSKESLNRVNPASYMGLDSLTYTLETSITGKSSRYSDGITNQTNSLAGLKKMAMGFQIAPYWKTSVGMIPFSNMGYDISEVKETEGQPDINYLIKLTGSGSINRFYWGNAFKLTPKLSIGANISFLFGTLTQNETVSTIVSTSSNDVKTSTYLHRIYLDYGFQYSGSFKNGWNYTLGGILGLKNKLSLSKDVVMTNSDSETQVSEGSYKSWFTIPFYSGLGVSVQNNIGFTFAMDYVFQKWGDQNSKVKSVKYIDAHRYAFGVEYIPAVRIPRNYFQRMFYQAGVSYNQSYLILRGAKINQYGLSLGAGFPIVHERSYFSVSYEIGTKGKVGHDLFRENYNMVNFNLVLRDIWFLKSKYD
jgi:hypothetical protein